VGFVVWYFSSVVEGIGAGVAGRSVTPGLYTGLGFGLMTLGPLIFWVVRPAYLKWMGVHSLLAWLFLVPSTLLALLLIWALLR
jgi:hypothetical protein